MVETDNHGLTLPTEDTFNWGEIVNQNFKKIDEDQPLQGTLSNRPSANGSRPPYIVVSPSADKGVYADVDGSWVQVAAP